MKYTECKFSTKRKKGWTIWILCVNWTCPQNVIFLVQSNFFVLADFYWFSLIIEWFFFFFSWGGCIIYHQQVNQKRNASSLIRRRIGYQKDQKLSLFENVQVFLEQLEPKLKCNFWKHVNLCHLWAHWIEA